MNLRCLSTLLFATASCIGGPSEPQTDSLAVEITEIVGVPPDVELRLSVRNASLSPVYLEGCPAVPAVVVEAYNESRWQEVTSANIYCVAVLGPRREVLRPGATIESRIRPDVQGEIRLRVLYGTAADAPYAAGAVSRSVRLD